MTNYVFKVTFTEKDTNKKTEKLFPSFNEAMETVHMIRSNTKNFVSNPVYVPVNNETFDKICGK